MEQVEQVVRVVEVLIKEQLEQQLVVQGHQE
jgi:hypothetical protein